MPELEVQKDGTARAKRVTIADIAEELGVHKATVSRALSETAQSQVNPETVRRVRQLAERLGYVPDPAARGLRTNTTMTVGVVIPDLMNPIFPPIVRGVEHVLTARGYTALLASAEELEAERAALASLRSRRVDGLIMGTAIRSHPLLREIRDHGMKVVLAMRGDIESSFPLVTSDDAAGMRAIAEHLYGLGHRRILHVAGPSVFSPGLARSEALAAAGAALGMRVDISEADGFTVEEGVRVAASVLDAAPRAHTAIVGANDMIALGVLRVLRSKGLSVPGDVSLVGFNDMPFAEDFAPSLTTVHVPLLELGERTATLLMRAIDTGVLESTTTTLPVDLRVRDSTGPATKGTT